MKLDIEQISTDSNFWNDINILAKEAFPPEEYLSPSKLVEMAKADNFDFLALLDEKKFVGFMVVQTYKDIAYLFFLAICSEYRSKGYGSKAIETLKEIYINKKQVVDLEMLDDLALNSKQREKRKLFYIRNGYKETGLFLSYLGVDYEVLCMDDEFEPKTFKEMMSNLKIEGFNPKYFYKKSL